MITTQSAEQNQPDEQDYLFRPLPHRVLGQRAPAADGRCLASAPGSSAWIRQCHFAALSAQILTMRPGQVR
jgi:hypothetical protein